LPQWFPRVVAEETNPSYRLRSGGERHGDKQEGHGGRKSAHGESHNHLSPRDSPP